MLACRNCRIPITSESGCAICEPLKKHLIQFDEDEESRPSLSEVGSEIVAELRYALRRARKTARDETADEKFRLAATGMILKVGNTASKVLESARKLQTDGLAAVRNMSFLERAKLFIEWYTALPPSYRAQLRDRMSKYELEQSKPVPQLVSGPEI